MATTTRVVACADRHPGTSGVYPAWSDLEGRNPPEDWLEALCSFDAKAKPGQSKWQHSSGFYDNGITHWLELVHDEAPRSVAGPAEALEHPVSAYRGHARELLLPALRQYRHNNSDAFVAGLDYEEGHRVVEALLAAAPVGQKHQGKEVETTVPVAVAGLDGSALEWAVRQPESDQPKTFGCHHHKPTCSNCDAMVRRWLTKELGAVVNVPTSTLNGENQ